MRQHKKCRKCYCASYIFHIFAFGERSSLQDILEFEEALCLSCGWEPRKFAIVHKDSIVVLTHIAWAAITISVYNFPRTSNQNVALQSHAFMLNGSRERLREINYLNIMNARHLFILCGTFLLFMACKDSPKQKSLSASKNPNHTYVIAIKSDISVKKESVEGKLIVKVYTITMKPEITLPQIDMSIWKWTSMGIG